MQYEACADLRNASLRNQLRDSLCSAHGIALMAALSAVGDLPRVAGGVGGDATAEAVDGRAEAVQLDVVDSRIVDVGWLCRNRSWIRHEGWLSRGWG